MKYIRLYVDSYDIRIIVSNDDDFSADDIKIYRPNNIPKRLKKEYNELPFHVGDIVRRHDNGQLDPEHMFIVDAVELSCNSLLIFHIETFKKDKLGFSNLYLWTTADSIYKVPEYEVDAINYNL